MALAATSRFPSATPHPAPDGTCRQSRRRRGAPWTAAVVAALILGGTMAGARADEVLARQAAVGPAEPRNVTISVRSPVRRIEGDRVTLQTMLRFSGRAWEDARIEILANGVVISETIAMRGGLWYAPRTPLAAGDYEFSARAVSSDGMKSLSDVLRITVSPPVLLDPESLAGKSVFSVG